MNDRALLEWMKRLDAKLDAVVESVAGCQARCQVDRVSGSRRRSTAVKVVAGAIVAAVSALAGRYLGVEP